MTHEPYVLRDIAVPRTFTDRPGGEEIVRLDIGIADGILRFVEPTAAATETSWREERPDRTMAWPCFVEPHTHLDSSQIWERSPNPDGSFAGATGAIIADRLTHWTPDDMRARMEFGLRCARAHGVRAMRTHLASQNDRIEERWEIFADLRANWAGRVDLQGVSLLSTDVLADPAWLAQVVGVVRQHDGVLGAFAPAGPHLDARLAELFDAAARHGLSLDFHADENGDPASDVLHRIALAAGAHPDVPVLVGHCCSLSVQPPEQVDRTLDAVADAGVAIVTLPGCNLYLQSREAGRTPRRRGVTLLHEMVARGIATCIGGDNCRDPYYPYGDFDPLESFRDAVRIAHLDHPIGDWPRGVTTAAGAVIDRAQPIVAGAPADLVLFRAASLNELLARPGTARSLIRHGIPVRPVLPDYSELDA